MGCALCLLLICPGPTKARDSAQMSHMIKYRLCGFSKLLDWKPTLFQEQLPAMRLCSVCGVLPKKVALLPCGHTHCEYCLQVSLANGSVCLLDKKQYREDLVEWLHFTEEWLAKSNVSRRNVSFFPSFVKNNGVMLRFDGGSKITFINYKIARCFLSSDTPIANI